ncbi:MAG TPA: RHS repeat-associated core domain-containing protein, partial [Alphaproteobacteria bacterium]|nr:RHS repeat-associated core domain-containing protein [Alphaproteobacteria bacterium]
MASDSSGSQIPAIRTFQLDSGSLGDLESSVNLFRGDVNLVQTLFTMPGRTSDQGLAITVSLLYQSNVYQQAMTWNRDAPTSVVGLGFTLPTTYIERNDGGSPTPGLWTYSYWSNGTQNTLVPEPATPFLFAMSAALGAGLSDGERVPAAIRTAFATRGIALGTGATLRTVPDDPHVWTIVDDEYQQLFTLILEGDTLTAYDGGQSFQLMNYQFWKILYYPIYERWAVTTESGQTMSFGGLGAPTAHGYKTALGNSIEWAVRWTTDDQRALWVGPSTTTTGQQQYARVWHLARVTNIWGDSTSYGYNEFPVDPVTGLIPGVEQLVGDGGQPYTKACYLTSLTDVFGRKAVFVYGDKVWDDSTPESPREYADPHKTVPDDTPNAYQDRYETKYLAEIRVYDPTAAPLFSLEFLYNPRPEIQGDARAVANVTGYTGALKGDTYKRYLTGIVLKNADGNALPGLVFDYYLDPTVAGASPGALKSITYPQGGVATYTYTQQSLAVCNRQQEVTPPLRLPDKVPCGGVPRVWFGPDYAVTTWYDAAKGQLALQVFTWLGRWLAWQIDANNPLLFDDASGLDFPTLNVIASQDYFALHFQRVGHTDVYLFRKNVAQPGQWVPATLDGVVTGRNTPTLSYNSTNVVCQAGSNFLIASVMSPTSPDYAYDRITWRWTTRAWSKESFQPTHYTYVAASGEYYVTLDAQTGDIAMAYLDQSLAWRTGPNIQRLSGFPVTSYTSIALVPGASMVAVSHLQVQNPQTIDYQLSIVQWDQDYALQPPLAYAFSDRQEPSGRFATTWIPTIVNNAMVAVSAHVLRFNGQAWLENSTLYLANPPSGAQQRYAYGPDYALQIVVDGNGVAPPTAKVLGFDPNTDSAGWSQGATTPAQQLPIFTGYTATANWPSSGQADYLTLGQYLYFRGTATTWQQVVALSPTADLQALVNQALGSSDSRYVLNSQSVVDQSPAFLAYYVYDTTAPTSAQTAVVILKNGQVFGMPTDLSDQRLCVAADPGGIGPGKYPGGPETFFSYPDTVSSFDAAKQYALYRYAGDAIAGNLTHYAVTGLSLQDGFQDPYATAYRPDPAAAACDPTGLVVKYYQSTVYPGTADPSNPQFGSVVNTYLNGLEVLTGENYYDMLDGLLLSVQTRDSTGVVLSEIINGWQVYTQRASTPKVATASILNLYGGFVRQTSHTKIVDGVTRVQTTSFCPTGLTAPYSGQPVSTTSATMGGSGTMETFTTDTTYGYEVNEAFQVLHLLTAPVQSVTTWTPASGGSVTMQAAATTYTPWPCAAGADVLVPGAEADFSWLGGVPAAFPFDTYRPGDVPAGWVTAGRILGRTPLGLVYEAVDGCGVVQATLYGLQAFPVAQFVNASLIEGQCAFWGFESYETPSGFSALGVAVTTTDAHTGVASLELPGGGTGSLAVSVTPANVSQIYVLGYWYKTPAGFQPEAGTGWTIVVSVDGVPTTPQIVRFEDTNARWAYKTVGIPLTAGQASLSITATATNTAATPVLLDSVFVTPLVSSLQAKTFDTGYNLVTSIMDTSGRTIRTLYDRFQRVVATVGPEEQTKELAQRFLSRQGNAQDAFDTASPNADLTLHPAGGGILESFLSGNEWTNRWDASNAAANWSVAAGTLTHTVTQPDTLTWRGWSGSTPPTAALFFEVVPQHALAGPVGIRFGAGYQIAFDPVQGYTFTDAGGARVQAPLARPPAMAEQWLLVLGSGVVVFFGDGQLLFSQKLAYGTTEAVAISTGPNLLQFRNLALVAEPRLGVSYADAAGRQRQVQQLFGQPQEGTSDARISAVIYDALDRQVAVTRTAPASFGTGAAMPLLTYRPGFADVEAFLQALSTTWLLQGDVADYYRGQADGPVHRSDDQGYPYRGYRFVAAPLKRQLERGLPGKNLAIHDVHTTTPAERQTLQFTYSANTSIDPALPAGDYHQRTVISPLKSQAISLVDTAQRQVFSYLAGPQDMTPSQTAGSVSYVDGSTTSSGGTLAIKLPNFFTSGPQTGQADYVSHIVQDPLGRVASRQDPSSHTTLYIYDPVGRLRFVQPQLDDGQRYFVYYMYDALGRLVEEGIIRQAWNAAALQSYAAQLDWPTAAVPHTAVRTYHYDGDGNDPTKLGQKIATVTANPAPAANPAAGDLTVTETFTYDSAGRIESVTLSLRGAVSQVGTITYAYNNLNEVTALTYPAGAPLAAVYYTYDDQGRVTGIGTSAEQPTDIAAYTYTADGEVQTERRNAGKLVGVYQYTSPGWLQLQTETVDGATAPSFSITYAYNADATLAQRTMQFAFPSATEMTQVTYTYDGQRRLTSAVVADGKPGNESVDVYDANGNIWRTTQDGAVFSFTCVPGSDCLQTADLDGTAVVFEYSADGWLTKGNDLAVERDACLGLTTNITVSGPTPSQVRLVYGGHSQRVVKQVTGATPSLQVLFCGSGQQPLATVENGAWTANVIGPTGLVALISTRRYFPLKDSQRTVWAVVDDQNALVARYNYLPFGGPLGTFGPQPEVLGYRFMGQPLDRETGLYNFQGRLYDPVLRRFYSPDPMRQFASPYLFVGNDPLTMVDPTGNLSVWARVGIGAALVAVAIAGLALSFATAGMAAPEAAAGEAALVGAVATGEAAGEAGAAAGAAEGAAAVGAAAAAGSEEGAAAGGEIAAGVAAEAEGAGAAA